MILPLAGISRIMESASIVLPQPDSPTIPRVSPAFKRQRNSVNSFNSSLGSIKYRH